MRKDQNKKQEKEKELVGIAEERCNWKKMIKNETGMKIRKL